MNDARYTTQQGRAAYSARPNRESLGKRLGKRVVASIWERHGCSCAYCGLALTPGAGAHLDHLTPKSKGGADVASNLVLACRACNSARQNMSLHQWAVYAATTRGLVFDWKAVRSLARRAA